jgi:YspA, cpYpsA-related SLOG family
MFRRRVIVAGSRTFDDYTLLSKTLVGIFIEKKLATHQVEIVSGGADGADKLGEKFVHEAKKKNIPLKLKVMEAEWDKRGESAGFIRNKEMSLYAKSNPDGMCIVFWDGASKGTKGMIEIAKKDGLDLHIINY